MSLRSAFKTRQKLWQALKPSSKRGGAYTFMVLAASVLLISLGSSLVRPTRQLLQLNHVRSRELRAQELASSGLEWAISALARNAKAQSTSISLDTGTIDVEIKAVDIKAGQGHYQVTSTGQHKNKDVLVFKYVYEAKIENKNGRMTLTKITHKLSENALDIQRTKNKN